MPEKSVICMGNTPASICAAEYLRSFGWSIHKAPVPSVQNVLLDVPSFGSGRLEDVDSFVSSLPSDSILFGGNLSHPGIQTFQRIDFLQDEYYLAENAAITAHCALQIAGSYFNCPVDTLNILIIGWGRIGKCLGKVLRDSGAEVTIAARKDSDLAILDALGYYSVNTANIQEQLHRFQLIFNTVPHPVIQKKDLPFCTDCVKIDLASQTGIAGKDVIPARGLPGKYAPEKSGALIAKTFLRLAKEVE